MMQLTEISENSIKNSQNDKSIQTLNDGMLYIKF